MLTKDPGGGPQSRHIELDIDIGADARDWSAIQAQEKLKPVETELRRIEELVGEIVGEMDYLRTREQKLRDTNESTNERVKWFAFGTMGMLVGLGAWQVVYLRAYFRYVHLRLLCHGQVPTLTRNLQIEAFDLVGVGRLYDILPLTRLLHYLFLRFGQRAENLCSGAASPWITPLYHIHSPFYDPLLFFICSWFSAIGQTLALEPNSGFTDNLSCQSHVNSSGYNLLRFTSFSL